MQNITNGLIWQIEKGVFLDQNHKKDISELPAFKLRRNLLQSGKLPIFMGLFSKVVSRSCCGLNWFIFGVEIFDHQLNLAGTPLALQVVQGISSMP